MKKALLYLLLAFGISIAVLMLGGALMGVVAGFIDGYNENHYGTTDPKDLMTYGMYGIFVVLCLIIHAVFRRLKFASYTWGCVPQSLRWRVVLLMLPVMGGMALAYALMYNPLLPADDTMLTVSDEGIREYYLWMKSNPWLAIPLVALIEATCDLVIYGGVLRELLEWKHRPMIIVLIYAIVMAAFGALNSPILIIPAFLVAYVEAWVYEYSRSIIPVVIGDIFFWIVYILLIGTAIPWWGVIVAIALVAPCIYFILKALEPYKPID